MAGAVGAGRRWFRAATVWLTVMAVLASGGVVLGVAAAGLVGVGAVLWLGVEATVIVACAFVSHRASRGDPRAILIAGVPGLAGLGLILALVLDRLMPWNDALYGISLDTFRGLWLPAAIVVPPAALIVVGSVRHWCAAGVGSERRRARAAAVLLAVIAVPIIVLALVDVIAPLCPRGRTCIPAAGVSLVLPPGWSRSISGDGLFEAGAGDTRRILIEDGQGIIGAMTSLDAVEKAAIDLVSGGSLGYAHSEVRSGRIELPIGPAVRVMYYSTPWFFQVEQNNITEWFFLGGRLVVIEYQEVPPGSAADDFQAVRDSLLPLSESL